MGTNYLVGDRFSVADLTAASLFYPLGTAAARAPSSADPPDGFERFREPLEDRPGYQWVAEMFRAHRLPARADGGRPCLTRRAYLDDRLDLDRDVEGQLGRADRRAGVAAGLAPDVEDQLREAVDHGGRLVEAGRAVDEPERLDPARDPVEIAELLLRARRRSRAR